MLDARRPAGRLLYLLLCVLLVGTVSAAAPVTTRISDVVYRGDGLPAAGTLLISWPAFVTASGEAVAAGTKSVTLGPQGALTVDLVPNAGATPAGTYYTVVFQLNDGVVKTEYWSVSATSPETIAEVRITPGTSATAAQMASRQYVDAAVAAKASDSLVVHTSGNESIAGVKQFSVPPVVPAPLQPTDAVNKAYVDQAVTNVGSGNYVAKAGDIMSGPLMLSGDPTAPNHASTRHYVDLGLAAKADRVNGVVPPDQLGGGAANGTTCLKGDSSWGACGTSSDAVSIQNVPVDTTPPTDNQVITYEASSGRYKPKAGGGVSAGMQAVKYATDFAWSNAPAADLSVAGAKTVNLASCPPGVKGNEPEYYVYITGTGTPEAAKVTGGTCNGDGQPGTLQFTTTNAHPTGYAVTSASSGLQETLIAARFTPTNPTITPQSGKVIVPPGELKAYARVSIRASNITVDFSGSIIECWMDDACIFVGDPSNSNLFIDVTLINPRGRPMVVNGTKPFIEVNAQKTRLFNVQARQPIAGSNAYFGTYVQVDDDQSFLLDGLDTRTGGGTVTRCDSTRCDPMIYAPGPFNTWSAVGWLKHLNLSMQTHGNGIRWDSGNSLRVTDSVIQGWAQYGILGGSRRGGGQSARLEMENVYTESNAGTSQLNPLGNVGYAGVIWQGARAFLDGIPSGAHPRFANTGSTLVRYYLVARDNTLGASVPLYAGYATTNGSGNITVVTPDIAGADTFDLLKIAPPPGQREFAPYGTGNYAVATSVTRGTACANGICTFTDPQTAPAAYTVPATTYFPLLDFWPGGLVLSPGADTSSVTAPATAKVRTLDSLGGAVVSVLGSARASITANDCAAMVEWTAMWVNCPSSADAPSVLYEQQAFLRPVKPSADGGTKLNLKGVMNFLSLGSGPSHIITLSDADINKTIATANNRPMNDANDAFIGYDQGNGSPPNIGISFGAPKSLSNYIGNVGDGTNWKERLTASLKEFRTDVQMDGALTVAGTVQADSFVSSGAGAWNVEGSYGALTPAAVGRSRLGFGANGKLSVSENGGAVTEVAKLDVNGNVAGIANAATALSQTPTQCDGSFATGIQANGNANCSTPDVIQLAGIPNYGLFWFDPTCHCAKIIANNGQPIQLSLLNAFNSDANTLEERNGMTAQALRVYGTYTDASNYERIGLKWDAGNNYFALAAENAGTGSQRGIGFLIGSTMRWGVSTLSELKPFADNSYNLGSSSLRVKTGYFGTSVNSPAVISPNVVNLNTRTAAIATTNLLANAPIGQYEVSVYVESDASCGTPGPAAVSVVIGWADRTGARTMTAPLTGNGVTSGAVALGTTANFGQSVMTVWNNSATNNITYATNYTACTSGTGTYALYIALRQVQ